MDHVEGQRNNVRPHPLDQQSSIKHRRKLKKKRNGLRQEAKGNVLALKSVMKEAQLIIKDNDKELANMRALSQNCTQRTDQTMNMETIEKRLTEKEMEIIWLKQTLMTSLSEEKGLTSLSEETRWQEWNETMETETKLFDSQKQVEHQNHVSNRSATRRRLWENEGNANKLQNQIRRRRNRGQTQRIDGIHSIISGAHDVAKSRRDLMNYMKWLEGEFQMVQAHLEITEAKGTI